ASAGMSTGDSGSGGGPHSASLRESSASAAANGPQRGKLAAASMPKRNGAPGTPAGSGATPPPSGPLPPVSGPTVREAPSAGESGGLPQREPGANAGGLPQRDPGANGGGLPQRAPGANGGPAPAGPNGLPQRQPGVHGP